MTIRMVEAAFTSGVTLKRTMEKILIGNVGVSGPAVKNVIILASGGMRYAIELRWVRGWAWRVLVGEDWTRGPGRPLPGGWRRLKTGDRIRGPDDVAVVLTEGSSPEPFLVDAETNEAFRAHMHAAGIIIGGGGTGSIRIVLHKGVDEDAMSVLTEELQRFFG